MSFQLLENQNQFVEITETDSVELVCLGLFPIWNLVSCKVGKQQNFFNQFNLVNQSSLLMDRQIANSTEEPFLFNKLYFIKL